MTIAASSLKMIGSKKSNGRVSRRCSPENFQGCLRRRDNTKYNVPRSFEAGTMLTENDTRRVWERMAEAEVRSLYFADLATRYTQYKQWITGASFILSAGTTASLLADLPRAFAGVQALTVAVLTAYSIAIGLDKRIAVLAKLHFEWNYLHSGYERLWGHWYEDDAEDDLNELIRRGREASQVATEMPYEPQTMNKWEELVYSRLKEVAA